MQEEVKKIVAKRTKFEEKLARTSDKQVYYEYIKYETLLEELKRKKIKRLGKECSVSDLTSEKASSCMNSAKKAVFITSENFFKEP